VNNKQSKRLDSRDKIRLLRKIDVLHSLDPEELEAIADNSAWRSFAGGEVVYAGSRDGDAESADGTALYTGHPKRGGTSGRIYAIQEGEVLITKSGDDGREVILANFVAGESFGELSLFDTASGDTAARCEEDTTLLVFPGTERAEQVAAVATALFADAPQIKAKILRNLLVVVARRIRGTNRLIAEKSPWVQELRRQVMLDKLTGLYNAGYLAEELQRLVQPRLQEERCEEPCLLMIKPDNLKSLNDRYGHQAGDRTLQLMAAELQRRCDKNGVPIRYKGDVFSVLLPRTGAEKAQKIAETIRVAMSKIDVSEVSRESTEPRTDLRITVSIGISACPPGGMAAEQLIEKAYENMFSARNSGGNRIHDEAQP